MTIPVSEGLLDLRRAQAFAATLDERWAEKSHDSFWRWIQLQALDEPKLAKQLKPGIRAPFYVRKSILRRLLDTADRGAYDRLNALEARMSDMRADIANLRRSVGLPPYSP